MIWEKPKLDLLLTTGFVVACALLIWSLFDLVNTFFVNVPLLDNWSLTGIYRKVHDNEVAFADFVAQHNEHRILLSRLIFVPLAFMTGWDLTYEAYATILVIVIIFLALARVAFYQRSEVLPSLTPLSVLLTCALLFSNIQFGSVMFPFNIQWFNVIAGASIAILALAWPNRRRRLLRFSVAVIACLASTYSAANGMAVWLALFPSLIVFARESNYRNYWIIAWLAVAVIAISLYFVDYRDPGHSPGVLWALDHPVLSTRFFIILLGRPLLPWGSTTLILLIGGILLAAYLYFAFVYLRRLGSDLSNQYAPWLSLGLLALIYAAMVTVGRVNAGEWVALQAPRYLTTTLLLSVCLIQLCRLYISHRLEPLVAYGKHQKPVYIVVLLFGFMLAHVIHESINTVEYVEAYSVRTKQYEQCLDAIEYAPDSCLKSVFPWTGALKQRAEVVEKIGFREFPEDVTFERAQETGPLKYQHGYMNFRDSVSVPIKLDLEKRVRLGGLVVRPSMLEPYMVFLSIGSDDPEFITSAEVGTELVGGNPRAGWFYSPWATTISERDLPPGKHVIQAWIYNMEERHFVKIFGEMPIEVIE